MKLICGACEERPVYVVSEKRRCFGSSRGVGAHDLCDKCYRSLRDRVVAARKGPKPHWAYRPTLKVLEDQGMTRRQDVATN